MSATLVFRCFHEDALKQWRKDREHFEEKSHPDCESIQPGVEHMAVADLAARVAHKQTQAPHTEFLFRIIVGIVGASVYRDGDYPRIISIRDVARASRMMGQISDADLRGVYDLDRLKADYGEIEEWLWDAFGPNVFDERLLPMFNEIKAFFHRAADRKQKIVVSWF
jgi:hypothetical protein